MTLNERKFYEHYESPAPGAEPVLVRVYCCPCCGYPTVGEPPSYDICSVCSWQDDGCDGGGPNACGIAEAQEYFRRYLTSYSPTHEFSPQFQGPNWRFVHQSECSPKSLELKRRLIAMLERYIAEPDIHRRSQIWQEKPFE